MLIIAHHCPIASEATLAHRVYSSNGLLGLHTTHTLASEVHASVVTEWPTACLHKSLPRGHQRGNWGEPWMKDLINICPTNPIQVLNLHDNIPDSKIHGANMGPIWVLLAVLEIPTGSPVRGRQLWTRTGNFLLIFLQFYAYDLRFKAWGPTTFLTEFQTLPVGPRWAPCWPHEPWYQGYSTRGLPYWEYRCYGIWVSGSHNSTMTWQYNQSRNSTTKQCAYFMVYMSYILQVFFRSMGIAKVMLWTFWNFHNFRNVIHLNISQINIVTHYSFIFISKHCASHQEPFWLIPWHLMHRLLTSPGIQQPWCSQLMIRSNSRRDLTHWRFPWIFFQSNLQAIVFNWWLKYLL